MASGEAVRDVSVAEVDVDIMRRASVMTTQVTLTSSQTAIDEEELMRKSSHEIPSKRWMFLCRQTLSQPKNRLV